MTDAPLSFQRLTEIAQGQYQVNAPFWKSNERRGFITVERSPEGATAMTWTNQKTGHRLTEHALVLIFDLAGAINSFAKVGFFGSQVCWSTYSTAMDAFERHRNNILSNTPEAYSEACDLAAWMMAVTGDPKRYRFQSLKPDA